ncbi:hypothetical protein V8C43DRAFT_267947 [Trichoderma afarasin]
MLVPFYDDDGIALHFVIVPWSFIYMHLIGGKAFYTQPCDATAQIDQSTLFLGPPRTQGTNFDSAYTHKNFFLFFFFLLFLSHFAQ